MAGKEWDMEKRPTDGCQQVIMMVCDKNGQTAKIKMLLNKYEYFYI